MHELPKRLVTAFERQCSNTEPIGIAFSGGLDSLTGALTARAAQRPFQLYTFELQGLRSRDVAKASAIARHFGWPLNIITIPAEPAADDFIRLIVQHGCKTKVQAEVTYGCLYLFAAIQERYVMMCMNADRYYGNSRQVMLAQSRSKRTGENPDNRKKQFDSWRQQRLARVRDLGSGDTWGFAVRAAAELNKILIDPYLDQDVEDLLLRYDHDQLSPASKPLIREAFASEIRSLDPKALAVGIRMQIGARVDERFKALLDNSRINRFHRKCRTTLHLCQTFAQAVEARTDAFEQEAASLPPAPHPHVRQAVESFTPYRMADVHKSSGERLFSVVSTFAGGGGSSIGYRLAGGSVLAASEFVPEAARTYARNFPDVQMDTSNIRDLLSGDSLESFLGRADLQPGDIDIMDGSPPCAEFSVAGAGIGDQDVPRKYSDVWQSGLAGLPFAFRTALHRARPRTFVMENVPNLAGKANREILQRLLSTFRHRDGERRYYAHYSILAASDFGVAQKRLRMFVIGVRADIAKKVGIKSDEDVLRLFPVPTHGIVSIRAALHGLLQKERDLEPWFQSCRQSKLAPLVRQLPKNPTKLTRLPNAAKYFTLTRCSWDLPAPTLVVTGQQPNGLSGALHPQNDRKFSLPELKRLFALPDDFVLTGSVTQAAERICRMVPPPLTKAIAASIYDKVLLPWRGAVNEA